MSIPPLDFDPATVSLPQGHFIGGRHYSTDETLIPVYRPSDGRLLGHIPDASADTVDHAVSNALQAWKASDWATRAPRERAKVLSRWAELIDRHAVSLAQLEAVGSTRPVAEAYASDVPFTAEAIRFFAELADKLGGEFAATRRDSAGFVVSEPYGVVGAITPWNFPLSMCSWKCGPALAAGNAVVLKPSELTPFSTLRLAELAIEAGVPPGIFNVVNGRGTTTGAAMTRHPDIAKISFTGSTRTGAAIMSDAALHGTKPVTLELGGKSPQLVFEHVPDMAHAARCIARGFTANGGQACVAGTRLIAYRRIVEPLLEAVQRSLAHLAPGALWRSTTGYSPIINRSQAERIDALIDESLAGGAELVFGGGYFDDTDGGCFYRPTLLANVTESTPAVQQELFGPVLTVQTFEDEEEGIALAGHPTYGLCAGVHTRDIGQAMRAMRRIAAGTVWINRYGRSADLIIPTGGFKQSGIGKDLGRQALEASLRYKSVLIDFDRM
ncbi:aldehyde dehydrogenase family protein [Burkholderia glumae]|uniref:aldehyde dehydrogenase family protein n=1 Tax=Burkholderia glumae TaxID=337 RepID=UPI00031F7A13|nr:aldehyde dehydrogenase family protein [Burkholderia glumae]PJO21181.1 aldehyde dehydrogenase [Burkholderia glumae AU6208]QHE13210.1 aldehyde dehydrogenase family protein [Burkholderia glumae AU6208]